jgi:hypothetical protein
MNMISTGSFLTEMDATEKQQTIAEKFARVWEMKNAKAARAGGVSLMALSLAACGSSSTDTSGSGSTDTGSTGADNASTGDFTVLRGLNNEPDEITIENGGATTGPDTVSATYNNDGANDLGTMNAGDYIDLGAGSDTVQIRAGDEMTAVLMPVLHGAETIQITNTAVVTAHTGLDVWAPDATSFVIGGSNATTLNDLAYATQAVTMNGTSGNLTLDGTGTSASITVAGTTAGDILVGTATTATLTVTGASTIDDFADGALTTLNIAGSGAFTLGAVTEDLTTISGANNTGGLDLTGVDATATSVTGSSAADVIGITGALDNNGDSTAINGGDGVDILVIDTNITDASAVTNVETLELSVDGLVYDMDTITGLTSIVVATDGAGGAGNADTANIDDYDAGTIVISDRNQADVDDNDTITVDIDIAEDFGEGDADSITVAIEATQAVGDDEEDFVVAEIDINDEGTGGENIEIFNINVTGERGVTISALNIDDQGDTPVVNINSAVDLSITGVAFETTVNDDDNGNTISFAGSAGDVTYTVGDLGYSADADDVITGGNGADTLSIDIADDAHEATVTGFETITITDANAGSIDLTNSSGYTTIALDGVTSGNGTADNIASGTTVTSTTATTATFNLDGAAAGSEITIDFSTAHSNAGDFTTGDEFTTVNFVVAEADADGDADDTDTIDVTFDAATSLNVKVSGADVDDTLALDFDVAATVTSLNIDADVAVQYSTAADTLEDDIALSFAGSGGVVTLTVSGAQLAEGDTSLTGGDGDEDILIVDVAAATGAATVAGFETVSISDSNAGSIDASDFEGVTTFDIDGMGTGALTVNDAEGTATYNIVDGGANAINLTGSLASGEGLSVSINYEDDVSTSTVAVTNIETVNIDTTVAQTGTILTVDDDTDTINITGENSIALAGGSDLAGAETINFAGFEGTFSGTVGDTVATTINLSADMTVGADLTLVTDTVGVAGTFVVDGTTAAAANLNLNAGTDTVVFASTLTNDVVIDGFETGLLGDVLDLSALGVTGIGDLTFQDFDDITDATTGGDDYVADDSVQITSTLFDGEIYLQGVTSGDLNVANFDFA